MATQLMEARSAAPEPPTSSGGRIQGGLLDPGQLFRSLPGAVRKLAPRPMWRNPDKNNNKNDAKKSTDQTNTHRSKNARQNETWLWLTVIFANLAEAVAEG